MESVKTKSLKNLEEKMEEVSEDSLRYHILNSARTFKTSWLDLGRALYSVWKDKLYKGWGFSTFDIYTAKEIGIRKQTALKLLKSYYFLEKEEPAYLRKVDSEPAEAASIPNYESIDLLRLAKDKKKIDPVDYAHLKKEVFENGRDSREVKKDLTTLIRQREELEPEEAFQQKRAALVRRLLGTLKSIREEAEVTKILSSPLIKELAQLIGKVEGEL